MNNAAILQHSVATERQQFMIQGWSGSHPALTGLGTCSAGVHRSLQRLRDELSVGKVIILLTYPWLWMNGCVPVGMLKGLGVTLCCATCFLQYSVQEQRVNRADLSRQLSCPELYCSSNLRCEHEVKSCSYSYRTKFPGKVYGEGKSQHHATPWVWKVWSDCPKGLVVAEQKIKTLM